MFWEKNFRTARRIPCCQNVLTYTNSFLNDIAGKFSFACYSAHQSEIIEAIGKQFSVHKYRCGSQRSLL